MTSGGTYPETQTAAVAAQAAALAAPCCQSRNAPSSGQQGPLLQQVRAGPPLLRPVQNGIDDEDRVLEGLCNSKGAGPASQFVLNTFDSAIGEGMHGGRVEPP